MVLRCRIRLSSREVGDNKGVAGSIGNVVFPTCCRPTKFGGSLRQHGVVTLLPTPTATPGALYRAPVLSGQRWKFGKSRGVRI
jgi:hypothetical protein